MATLNVNPESIQPVSHPWVMSSEMVAQQYPAIVETQSASSLALKVVKPQPRKWTFLIANQICFSDRSTMAIRLAKPEHDKLYPWLNKIIDGGQCDILYVENLAMGDFRVRDLISRCESMGVTLVNLTVGSANSTDNIIHGPWH